MDRPFIASKLRRPTAPRNAIARSRLVQRLNQGLAHKLILVSAPAGYGKTTAVSDWLGRCSLPSAWLGLDEDDSDTQTVMSYVTATVESVYPEACRNTRALLQLPRPPPAAIVADQFASDLCGLTGDLVLVLDDCHHVHDLDVYRILSKVLRHPPGGLHLVIVTRYDPPLPLGTLRAQDGVTEIRLADLRFTPEETRRLFRQSVGWRLAPTTLEVLEEQLEGWPVGLHLLLRALEGTSGQLDEIVQAMLGSVQPATDYLAAEMLSTVPGEVRRRLIETSLLERFSAPLVDALCPEPGWAGDRDNGREPGPALDGTKFLHYLKARDLFIVPLDLEGEWYRYHGVLQTILRQYLATEYSEAARNALHRRAAEWYRQHGPVDQALHHAAVIGDWDSAVDIVRGARIAAVNREDWFSLRRWLGRLPHDIVEDSPELLVVRAFLLQHAQQLDVEDAVLDRAEALVDRADRQLPVADRRVFDAEVAGLRSNTSYWRADGAGCMAAAERALKSAPEDLAFIRGSATLYLGLGQQLAGHTGAAQALLRRALEDSENEPATYQTRLLVGLGLVSWASADLAGTLAASHQLKAMGERHGLLASLGWGNWLGGIVSFLRDDLTAALEQFAAIVDRPFTAHPLLELQAYFGLAMIHRATGQRAEAATWADHGAAWALEWGIPGALDQAEAFRARLALAAGQVATAVAWTESRLPPQSSVPIFMIEEPSLTWIQVQLARGGEGGLAEAAAALEAQRRFGEETHNALRLLHVLALEALLLDAQGHREAAVDTLSRSLALAEPGAIVRPFLDLRPSLAPLLRALVAREGADGHCQLVLDHLSDGPRPAGAASPSPAFDDSLPVDALTPREQEVLALLEQRYSNREIAARLVVSPVTVKSHTHSIYSKLDVRGRREAVARAKSLGLLAEG